ncbi:MAG: AarF/ABC1/UbiB kinase family protein, partial [Planctomycetes bacterium]|nr:AarF/ABC1/UbiB kinase family protein [Planctomycetota bacterium]
MPIYGLGFIGREYRHLKRYRQIAMVLFKYGLGDLVDTIGLRRRLGLGRLAEAAGKEAPPRLTRWERHRMALEELGPSFVKLGQIASTRPDMLPHDLCLELEKLQDTVKPFGIEQVRQVIQKELG